MFSWRTFVQRTWLNHFSGPLSTGIHGFEISLVIWLLNYAMQFLKSLMIDFTGTDTIGCIRIPAAFCGILGFRPSHGAVSTIGVLPNSQSLDTVGMEIFI